MFDIFDLFDYALPYNRSDLYNRSVLYNRPDPHVATWAVLTVPSVSSFGSGLLGSVAARCTGCTELRRHPSLGNRLRGLFLYSIYYKASRCVKPCLLGAAHISFVRCPNFDGGPPIGKGFCTPCRCFRASRDRNRSRRGSQSVGC